ncbi:carbohydrate-binding module family 13 protein [Coniophora puteana RWD-64-598 SS2]|uniref:Carbohydrate-binding module family 13 protein n=1 Tax=Coniophora puteana (strain RWD-64-598) TaxID=741705 RepID=R7SDH5_CONPW|nr:carbohydrate-binding module family 13 protein [Coniophora puteana RWD-64-598 SS2]EIW74208.1 carbohydrate-binding module family 13 protein [Coniophora puteana RWD-64-598 SS2]
MAPESGKTYKIRNLQVPEKVVDLSGADQRSVIGWNDKGGGQEAHNQAWRLFRQNSGNWTIESLKAPGTFIGIASGPGDGVHLIGQGVPLEWQIIPNREAFAGEGFDSEREANAFRLLIPGMYFNADLADHGNAHTIQLWGKWRGQNQAWTFEEFRG